MAAVNPKEPRLYDAGYLAFLRRKPCCCGCNRAAPSEAAHIRIGLFAGAMKPHDHHALPLNAWCHRQAPDSQHANENGFWARRGLDPFELAARYYAEYGGTGGKPKKRRTKTAARRPKEARQKIPSRKNAWPKRKFGQ